MRLLPTKGGTVQGNRAPPADGSGILHTFTRRLIIVSGGVSYHAKQVGFNRWLGERLREDLGDDTGTN